MIVEETIGGARLHPYAEYWKEMIVETAAILVVSEYEHRRAVYIQRSPIFGFPDIVTVEFVAFGPERSSVAVYSRSRYRGQTASSSNKRMNASVKNPHW